MVIKRRIVKDNFGRETIIESSFLTWLYSRTLGKLTTFFYPYFTERQDSIIREAIGVLKERELRVRRIDSYDLATLREIKTHLVTFPWGIRVGRLNRDSFGLGELYISSSRQEILDAFQQVCSKKGIKYHLRKFPTLDFYLTERCDSLNPEYEKCQKMKL